MFNSLISAERSPGGIALIAVMIFLFSAAMVFVGIYTRRKARDVNGFVLGGRSVGPWLTAFTYGTSYFSAVIFIGYAGQFGYLFGVASTWIGIGNAVLGSLLAWVVLGRRTTRSVRRRPRRRIHAALNIRSRAIPLKRGMPPRKAGVIQFSMSPVHTNMLSARRQRRCV